MNRDLLIVFCKNPVLGKVKSRLADTVGEKKALEVYIWLLKRTHSLVSTLPYKTLIAYSDFINNQDLWENERFMKSRQKGEDLGERMYNAIQQGFFDGYEKVCLIGVDIPDLNTEIINEAFSALDKKDAVIGPAKDGGYYLIGFSKSAPDIESVFRQKEWGTSSVYKDTLRSLSNEGLSQASLPTLSDVDTEEDLTGIQSLSYFNRFVSS